MMVREVVPCAAIVAHARPCTRSRRGDAWCDARSRCQQLARHPVVLSNPSHDMAKQIMYLQQRHTGLAMSCERFRDDPMRQVTFFARRA